jgi:hypothetical protein
MVEIAFSGNSLTSNTLEEKIFHEEKPLTGLTLKRKNFHFPKDFDFNDKDFEKQVLELYGRNNFDRTKSGWKNERRERKEEYHQKCKEYFVEFHDWPKWVANSVSKLIRLPAEKQNKKVVNALISYSAGNLPKRYVEPLSKFMGEKREYVTKVNIVSDIATFAAGLSVAYGLTHLDSYSPGWVANAYDYMGLGNLFKDAFFVNLSVRGLQIPARIYAQARHNVHIPSFATLTDPNLLNSIPNMLLFGYDAYKKIKTAPEPEETKSIPKTAELTPSYLFSPLKIGHTSEIADISQKTI